MSDFTFPSGCGRQGWICPKCGAVMSPDTDFCLFCVPKQVSINAVGTDYIEIDWTKSFSVANTKEEK